jgi:hypothetical protein
MQIVHLIYCEKHCRAWNGLHDAVKCDIMTSRQVRDMTSQPVLVFHDVVAGPESGLV